MKRVKILETPRKSVEAKTSPASDLLLLAIPKSILNEDMIRRFCRLIKKGLPPDAVCDYLNVSRSAFQAWVRKGETFRNGGNEPKEFALYAAFVGAFRRASATYRKRIIAQLHRSGNQYWAKEMTILERRDRKNFSRHEAPGQEGNESFDPDERFL